MTELERDIASWRREYEDRGLSHRRQLVEQHRQQRLDRGGLRRLEQTGHPGASCIFTGGPAVERVLIGRSY